MKKDRLTRKTLKPLIYCILLITISLPAGWTASFHSAWPPLTKRVWAGPEYWANRLQDWRVQDGRLECEFSGPNRNLHLLTRDLSAEDGRFEISVRLGRFSDDARHAARGWAGFRLGARANFDDYRRNAVYGDGLNMGITDEGALFVGDPTKYESNNVISTTELVLKVTAQPGGPDEYQLILTALDPEHGEELLRMERRVKRDALHGNIALVCHTFPDTEKKPNRGEFRFWFKDWTMSGDKIAAHDDRVFGPILWSQYTLSRGVMKMTAQMAPTGPNDAQSVRLQTRRDGEWRTLAEAPIDPLARTAEFRREGWDASRDVEYRLVYGLRTTEGHLADYEWRGVIRHDPAGEKEIAAAGFTGNNDFGFPNADVVEHVGSIDPDVLIFTGDQIYEGVAGYGVQRSPLDKAALDYLRKWYLYGWSYRGLMKDRPTISIPDDHDVYHGNIWGMSGKKAIGEGKPGQDSGGYTMPAEWVNMVQRTQTSHLPDPYDPTPVLQGVGVYYTEMEYGGISFAIIEDRKFKSSPSVMLPGGDVVNGWALNRDFDATKLADVKGAVLLGERQMRFLQNWAEDWAPGVWMKCLVSQTIFANVATLPSDAADDNVVPKLRILPPGEYAQNDVPAADMDSNGWPQTPRNEVLRVIRKCFAIHIAGDQHLGSTIQYGVDDWGDASYAFCVPAIANVFPRRWFPPEPGANRDPMQPRYTGEFHDGFGNLMTVFAVSNPVFTGLEPAILHDRATGYGIVRFQREGRSITMECWPRFSDPAAPGARQYPGWPITIHQQDNYGRKPAGWLPLLRVKGMDSPVVRVYDESSGELVFALRIQGVEFQPKVFHSGSYTIQVGEPERNEIREFKHVESTREQSGTLTAEFQDGK
ncbi:MAG: twin-arginine translocation pathway signal protein [bacterium]|nr:twin-arginine translocation pathway signal protein [bacterium]